MIKFTMGSSDAKKTPRRKPKRTAGKSYLLPSNLSGSGSNPTGPGSNSQAPTNTVVNGCFQNTMPTSTNTFMHSLGDSLAAYSQVIDSFGRSLCLYLYLVLQLYGSCFHRLFWTSAKCVVSLSVAHCLKSTVH